MPKLIEKIKDFHPPKIGLRMVKTLVSVLIICVAYEFLLGGRNPCFACIGAVYGMGSAWHEGFRNGINRFIGTVLGGLLVLPFYPLYWKPPFGIPDYVFLMLGVLAVIYVNVACGAHSAVQPATVVYFVVMFTQIESNYAGYTIARIIDTGVGVAVSLLLSYFWPSPDEKQILFGKRDAARAVLKARKAAQKAAGKPAKEKTPAETTADSVQ